MVAIFRLEFQLLLRVQQIAAEELRREYIQMNDLTIQAAYKICHDIMEESFKKETFPCL